MMLLSLLLLMMLMKFVTTGVGNRSALLLPSTFQTETVVLFGVFVCCWLVFVQSDWFEINYLN